MAADSSVNPLASPQENGPGRNGPEVTEPVLKRGPVRVWRINVRLLVATLLVIVVAAPCLYFWYQYQVSRQATALMDRAQKLYDEENWNQAAALLHQFLQLRPD